MAYTKAQLEALKNSILASAQPINAAQHRSMVQNLINEMFDPQSRGNLLAGVQADGTTAEGDTTLLIRSGQAYLVPAALFGGGAANLAGLGDVVISDPQDGDFLVFDGVSGKWKNVAGLASNVLDKKQGFNYSGSNTFTLDFEPLSLLSVELNGQALDITSGLALTVDGLDVNILYDLLADDFIQIKYLTGSLGAAAVSAVEASSIVNNALDLQRDEEGGNAANDSSILSLDSVTEFAAVDRKNRTRFYVNDPIRGGMFSFYPASAGLTPDGGSIFATPDGFAVRQFDGFVFPEWFGAIGDGVVNDFAALQAAFDTGLNVFLNVGKVFAYSTQLVISNRDELVISGKGKLKDLGKSIALLSGTTLTSVGILIQDCQNIDTEDLTILTSNTSSDQVNPTANSQRVPAIDFQNCKNLKINGINFGGRVGPYISFASAVTDFELMASSFLRVYNCEAVRLTDGRILNDSGAGESFCFNLTTNIFVQNCGFIEETGDRTFGLFKIINCENITIDSLYTKKTSGISSFIDVIGKNFEIRNTHIDNPTGKFLDISKEWVEDTESDNISIINCSGNGEGVRSAVSGTKVQRIKRVNIDNLTIDTVGTDSTLVTATEFDLVTIKNCKLLNPLRLLFYDQVVTSALQNSVVEDFELTASVAASGNTFRLESGAGYQVWRNGLFSFGFFKELRIGDYIGGTGKDLALSRSRFIEFVNVTFQEMTIVLNNNVKFTNCTFRNCAFDFNRSVGSMNTNALVEFTGGEIKYDLNYSRTDGRIFQTFGGLLTAKFAGVSFTGLLHNTGGRGLLDNITAAANAYSGTWDFKDCFFDLQRWTGSTTAEQQIVLVSNSVNTSIPMGVWLSNCRVTDKMFLATFRGATSSGSTNYLTVTINKVVMESVSVNAFAQTTGTTSLDRCRLTVQNSIFGNEARNRIIAASGNTFNAIRYINNIDSLNASDI